MDRRIDLVVDGDRMDGGIFQAKGKAGLNERKEEMEFRNNEAIYLQIAAYVSEKILRGVWLPDEKIPSVRDLAVELQVNPNTVMRTYEFLESQEVIYNKRGIGFFVAADGIKKVKVYRKDRFLQQDLPEFFRNIYLLEIPLEELQARYEQFKTANFK